MKLMIIADDEGSIVATANAPDPRDKSDDHPTQVGLIPQPGQSVYEVDAPDAIAKIDCAELHLKYRVEVKGLAVKLVKCR